MVKKKKEEPEGEKKANLEDRIVNTNPILESYGNAKTIRNDNSSRFGKFIRIYFNQMGKLAGGYIDVYLLEKSRVTYQQPNERGYHIFFQLIEEGPVEGLQEMIRMTTDPYDYFFISQGKVKVDSIDDNEELEFTDQAFDTLGFSLEEKQDAFKTTAVICHLGEMTFKQKGREESCEMDDPLPGQKSCELCGIENWQLFYGNFIRPKIKVGTEWVYKGQNADNCLNAISGIGRSIYERVFTFIMEKCNQTLFDPTMKKIQYIGCLDIAGFEIFDYNGFEQICINFCNEKLQQFFNQHMFVLEQEEYVREGIEWANVDFGMDLQACITMFEKPMGLLAIFEEESLFPKATDASFAGKLHENLLGKCPNFQKPSPKPDPGAHFAVVHYAATVSYNLTAWLEKNKDPLNDTIIELFKNGSNPLLVNIFYDHPGQPTEAKKDAGAGVFKAIALDPEKWRLGHTKVFFRAGILGLMEEVREDRIGEVLSWLQAQARGKASRLVFKKMQDQKLALYCLQRTIRNYYIGKTWLWWQMYQNIKPHLKCSKFAQYKAEYEEKIAIAEAHIDKALEARKKVEAVHQSLSAQKNELVLALQSGGSAVQDIIDKTNRVEAMAADVQKSLDEVKGRVAAEKAQMDSIGQAQSKISATKAALGAEIQAMEARLGAAEQDRADKDDQIRTLKEEIEHQNDMISKLGREKKGGTESKQKTEEDIQSMEDRCNHLCRLKSKLEQSLDEAEDSLEREKKAKSDIEKIKRKVEGDLKLTQETISDLERVKSELNQSVQRKEKESAAISAKIDDEATLGSKYNKQVKELQARLEELDEELSIERANRAKAEKSRSILKDIEDLGSR